MNNKIARFVSLGCCAVFALSLASCSKSDKVKESASESLTFESSGEAYDTMIEAVSEGDYQKALDSYKGGASASGKENAEDTYNYALAMHNYNTNGSVGKSLYILENNVSDGFYDSSAKIGELMGLVRGLNGMYYNSDDSYYMAIEDGMIAISTIELSGVCECTYEVVVKDGKFYFATTEKTGTDALLYEITRSDTGLTLTGVENGETGSVGGIYSGSYKTTSTEYPTLIYK